MTSVRTLSIVAFAFFSLPCTTAFGAPQSAQSRSDALPGAEHASRDTLIKGWAVIKPSLPHIATFYLSLDNSGTSTYLISGVNSPFCTTIYARHEEQEEDNETADLFHHLAIPAKTMMVFPEGGYHLVCRLKATDAAPPETFPVTFSFLGGSSKTVPFPVHRGG